MHLPAVDVSAFDFGPNVHERCGVIIDNGADGYELVELPNRSDLTTHHFIIWNADIKAALPEMTQIVGVVHTHPFRSSSLPSTDDIDSIPSGLIGMVYHPSTTSITWYDENGIIKHIKKRKRR